MREELILEQDGSLEDEITFTVVPREIYRAHRGRYNITIVTSRPLLWRGNKFISSIVTSHPSAIKIPTPDKYLETNQKHKNTHILQLQLRIVEEHVKDIGKLTLTEFRPHLRLELQHAVDNPELDRSSDHTPYWIVHTDLAERHDISGWDPARWFNAVTHLRNGKYDLDFLQVSSSSTLPYVHVKGAANLRELGLDTVLWLVQHAHGIITTDYVFPHIAAALGRPCIVLAGNSRATEARGYTDEVMSEWFKDKDKAYLELVSTLMPQDYLIGKGCKDKPCGNQTLLGYKHCENVIDATNKPGGPTVTMASCMCSLIEADIVNRVAMYEDLMQEVGYNDVDLAIQEVFKEVQKGD
jgi:hypothetical protein